MMFLLGGFKSSSNKSKSDTLVLVTDQRLFSSNKYELKYELLYYSGAKVGYCCKLCKLFSATDENIFINGTGDTITQFKNMKTRDLL
jgi:hypothetical protein